MPTDTILNYNFSDPAPDTSLGEINDLYKRAIALLARTRTSPALQSNFTQILGAIEMIHGLQYHIDKFQDICRELGMWTETLHLQVRHEVVAYVNRMGQFRAFARSGVASARGVTKSDTPTIEKFGIFRDKVSAHRSIDDPRRLDTPDLQLSHARSLSTMGGSVWVQKPTAPTDGSMEMPMTGSLADISAWQRRLVQHSYLTFQLHDGAKHVHFAPAKEHAAISNEAYRVVEKIVLHCAG